MNDSRVTDTVKSWYRENSCEIKLLQYLLYHLKKSGHIVKTKKGEHTTEKETGIQKQYGDFLMTFE